MRSLTPIHPEKETERIAKFIRSSFAKVNKNLAVIALSGGLDSATAFLLTVKALSPTKVLAYYLPAKNSDQSNWHDVQELKQLAQLPTDNLRLIAIGAIIQKAWRIIKHYSSQEGENKQATQTSHLSKGTVNRKNLNAKIAEFNRLRLANIAARVRMMVLYDQAKKHDALVVGTENMSEHLLGYYTRFGDEASDIEPIRHLFKTQVRQLAKFLGMPKEIMNKPPAAGLWPGQTDANELGFSYEEADPILYLYKGGKRVSEMVKAGYRKSVVEKVLHQVEATKYKHEVPYLIR